MLEQTKSFIGHLRDELLNEVLFRSLAHALAVLDAWRADYNTNRLHSRLGGMSPQAYSTMRRFAALRYTAGSAQRTAAAITVKQGPGNRSTPITLDKTWGQSPVRGLDWKAIRGLDSMPVRGLDPISRKHGIGSRLS